MPPAPETSAPRRTRTLSEAGSKELIAGYGVPVPSEREVATPEEAAAAAEAIGFPAVVKLCGQRIAHKTERGLVHLGLQDAAAVEASARDLLARAQPEDGQVSLLVAPMVRGDRELIAGVARDPQFGPTVLFGAGGVLAEAVADVVVRLAPLSPVDAEDMLAELAAQALLGELRGQPAVDRAILVEIMLGLSRLALEHPEVVSVDVNPLVISAGRPVAVDALVEVEA